LNPVISATEEKEYITESGEIYYESKKEEDVTMWPSLSWFKKSFKAGKKINTKSGITPVDDGCNTIEVLVEKINSK
jgi:hypothetical protein